jgi:hypothetical protein
MNILERLSDDAEGEHGRVIDELLDFLKRSQWRDVPEAFGPMFENYFRNGLQLLLSAEGDDASILDFPRVFSDDASAASCSGSARTRTCSCSGAASSRRPSTRPSCPTMRPTSCAR